MSAATIPITTPLVVLTLGEYARRWLRQIRSRVRPATWRGYERQFRLHLLPKLGDIPLARLTRRDVRHALEACEAGGMARSTLRNPLIALQACLQSAVEDECIPANVAHGAGRKLVTPGLHPVRHPLTDDEVVRLLAACDRQYVDALTLLVLTGIRIGEACALEWRDIDVESRRMLIRHTWSYGRATTTKNGKAQFVDLSRDAVELLQARRDNAPETRWVFQSRVRYAPSDPSMIRRAMRHALEAAGLPRAWTPHGLRHTCATRLLRVAEPQAVQLQLRHASIRTTVDLYGAFRQHRCLEALDSVPLPPRRPPLALGRRGPLPPKRARSR